MTDINDLDRHIGRYVDLSSKGEGASGFLVDVLDEIDYIPEPVRWVTLDWGQGWRVGSDTVISFPEPPHDEECDIVGPVRRIHLAMHGDRQCEKPDICTFEGMAVLAVRETRVWRMKQSRAYWQHRYISRARGMKTDPDGIERLIQESIAEGAPMEFVEHLQIIKHRALMATGKEG